MAIKELLYFCNLKKNFSYELWIHIPALPLAYGRIIILYHFEVKWGHTTCFRHWRVNEKSMCLQAEALRASTWVSGSSPPAPRALETQGAMECPVARMSEWHPGWAEHPSWLSVSCVRVRNKLLRWKTTEFCRLFVTMEKPTASWLTEYCLRKKVRCIKSTLLILMLI